MDHQHRTELIACLNGEFVPASTAGISVADQGFVHGAAVAEMIRTFAWKPFRVADHLERLRAGIEALEIIGAPTETVLQQAIETVLGNNTAFISPQQDLGIILFVTAGMNPTYTGNDSVNTADNSFAETCTWGVHSFPLPFHLWAKKMEQGHHLAVPPQPHLPIDCLNPQMKWRSRVHWFLADRWASRQFPGSAALLCDTDGHITETSSANIFLVQDGCLRTPRAEKTLNGISRRVTLEFAKKLGIPWEWADLCIADLLAADELFLSSTPYGLMPVTRFEGNQIGHVSQFPIFQQLQFAWNDAVGLDIIAQMQTATA